MAVTLNAKGTSASSFKIGKKGTTLYQGQALGPIDEIPQGSFWFDSLLGGLKFKGSDPTQWKNLTFDNISFLNDSIISVTEAATISLTNDIVLTPHSSGEVTTAGTMSANDFVGKLNGVSATYDRSSVDLSGAEVFDRVTVSNGIVTSVGTRDLTLGDLGYTGSPVADAYGNWKLKANTGSTTDISSGETVTFKHDGGTIVSRTGNEITIKSPATGYVENSKNYPVELDENKMYVNVPWTDTDNDTIYGNWKLKANAGTATDISSGETVTFKHDGGTIVSRTGNEITIKSPATGYVENSKNYPVELSDNKMYVTVPWTDNNTIYGNWKLKANTGSTTDITSGNTVAFIQSGGTTITRAGNDVTIKSPETGYVETGKNYPVELSNNKMYVNVPWVDATPVNITDNVTYPLVMWDQANTRYIKPSDSGIEFLPTSGAGVLVVDNEIQAEMVTTRYIDSTNGAVWFGTSDDVDPSVDISASLVECSELLSSGPIAGDTADFSGVITLKRGTHAGATIDASDGGSTGTNLIISSGGNTVVGAGESTGVNAVAPGNTGENLYLGADGTAYLYTNAQTWTAKYTFTFGADGKLTADDFVGKLNGVEAAYTNDSSAHLSGATVYDKVNVKKGIVTSLATRDLTLGDLGYTGDTEADAYGNWKLKANTGTATDITSGGTVTFQQGGATTVSRSDNVITISSTDTKYTHPTYSGDDITVKTDALTGATVISDLHFNITTNTGGHVTDATLTTLAYRDLTLGDLGYTGSPVADAYGYWSMQAEDGDTEPVYSTDTATFKGSGGTTVSLVDQTLTIKSPETGYVETGKNYPVELSNNKMYVNVPWTDTDNDTIYGNWKLKANTGTATDITSGGTVTFQQGGATTVSRSDNVITISSTDTKYTHPSYDGDEITVDTGALTGATVISDLHFNITTNTGGHVTDATLTTLATRDLTLANLGYTGSPVADAYGYWSMQAEAGGEEPVYSTDTATFKGSGGTTVSLDNQTLTIKSPETGYVETGKNYPVELSNNKMYVNVPWTDNNTIYGNWKLKANTGTATDITSGGTVAFKQGGATTVTRSGNDITISSTNTVYTHPSYDGDEITVDTGALTGATVISDLHFNITTNTGGHVTDATLTTLATRELTLGDLGYTGDTEADAYGNWKLKANTGTATDISSSETVTFTEDGGTTITRSGNEITIKSYDLGYASGGNNYAVQEFDNEMYVNVPWVDATPVSVSDNVTYPLVMWDQANTRYIKPSDSGIEFIPTSGNGVLAVDYEIQAEFVTADNLTSGSLTTDGLTVNSQISLRSKQFIDRQFATIENASPQYILLCGNVANNDVNGTIRMNRTSGNYQAVKLDIIVSSGSSIPPYGTLLSLQSTQTDEEYTLVTVTYNSVSYVAIKYVGNTYPSTGNATFSGRISSTTGANTLVTVTSAGITDEAALRSNKKFEINGLPITYEATDIETNKSFNLAMYDTATNKFHYSTNTSNNSHVKFNPNTATLDIKTNINTVNITATNVISATEFVGDLLTTRYIDSTNSAVWFGTSDDVDPSVDIDCAWVRCSELTSTGAIAGTEITGTDGDFSGSVVIKGDLTVDGVTDIVQRDISTGENAILLNALWPDDTAPTSNAGLFVYRGNTGQDTVGLAWTESSKKWSLQSRSGVDPDDPDFSAGGGSITSSYDIWHTGNLKGGTGANDFAKGNHTHGWSAITGKPDEFPPESHNHTSLTNVTRIGFNANTSDSASISTTIASTTTYFDFNLSDDNNQEQWRWRFTPSGSTVYDAMALKPASNGRSNLTVSGGIATGNTITVTGDVSATNTIAGLTGAFTDVTASSVDANSVSGDTLSMTGEASAGELTSTNGTVNLTSVSSVEYNETENSIDFIIN